MKEAEVSLYVALHYIEHGLTDTDVIVSLDGAHVRIGSNVHFDVSQFLVQRGWHKMDSPSDSWQGIYLSDDWEPKLVICCQPGIGDVTVRLKNGKTLRVESKKGVAGNKSGSEYPLMREAIGQLMTGCELTDMVCPAVAVPYTERSHALAEKWSGYPQIKAIGLRFLLVKSQGEILII